MRIWKHEQRAESLRAGLLPFLERFRPDVIVSFDSLTTGEIRGFDVKTPMISCFRNDPAELCVNMLSFEKRALETCEGIQVLSPSFVDAVGRYVKCRNVRYIPNTICQSAAAAELGAPKSAYKIINVARLNKKQKRQEILIEAFASLAEDFPAWTVEFWGLGTSEEEERLVRLIHEKGLEDRVFLKGRTREVNQILLSADLFAFPSAYEGFGQAVVEAMTAGLPVAAFRSCSGVNEIVEDGYSGFLAEDGVTPYAEALRKLMGDTELRVRMGKNAREAAKAYAPENVWKLWDNFLRGVLP